MEMEGKQLTFFEESKRSSEFAYLVAQKLVKEQVLFFISAGLSINWGYKTASELAEELLQKYSQLKPDKNNYSNALKKIYEENDGKRNNSLNLTEVAEALAGQEGNNGTCFLAGDIFGFKYKQSEYRQPWFTYEEFIEIMGQDSSYLGLPHLIIARLAKEGLIDELITTNYDTLLELALWSVGMERLKEPPQLDNDIPWAENFVVIYAKNRYIQNLPYRSIFRLHKIHGCVDALINHFSGRCKCSPKECTENLMSKDQNFVITHKDLLDWRADQWAQSMLEDRARNHFMVFAGFSGSDNVVHNSFRNIFQELKAFEGKIVNEEFPRAVAIDPSPNILLEAILKDATGKKDLKETLCITNGGYKKDYHHTLQPKDKKSKYDLELVFKDIYAETIKCLLEKMLKSYGERVINEQCRKSRKSNPWKIVERKNELLKYIQDIALNKEDNIDFLTWTLPGAVAFSWLLNKPWTAEIKQSVQMERFFRPYYYVPLNYNPEITIGLLRIYQVLRQAIEDSKEVDFLYYLHQGWMKIIKNNGESCSILPLFLPRANNSFMFQNFDHDKDYVLKSELQSSSKIVIVEFQKEDNKKPTNTNIPFIPLSWMGQMIPQVNHVKLMDVWGSGLKWAQKILATAF